MKNFFIVILFWSTCFNSNSQSITAQLIDEENKNPIQYATIKTGPHSGLISNEEGFFTINSETSNTKSVTISCLGYENRTISVEEIKALNYIVPLTEAINELREVYISNRAPNADSIIARVKAKLSTNYETKLNKYNVFRRTTDYVDFKSLVFEIEKASHIKKKNLEDANASLIALSKKIRKSDIKEFTDFNGVLYCFDKDSSKLIVNKATKLLDYKNDFSMDEIQEKAQGLVLKYLDTTKTYKLKTGLFKIEDSLSLKEEDFKDEDNPEQAVSILNNHTQALLRRTQFYDNSFLNKILDDDLYNYHFEKMAFNNEELTYIISFTPRKGKSKYTGKLFIHDDSYAITRVDYNYYKNRHGQKVNLKLLLGVKYSENKSEGTLLFEKSSINMYHPRYIKHTTGSYFYVSRDVKFIENSSAKNKVNFSFKLEGDNRNKEELLFTAHNKLSSEAFNALKQDSVVLFKQLSKFEKTIWESEETIVPLEEMKNFSIKD